MATYVVGDLQGCLAPLKTLLKEVNFDTQKDQLWLTGDLINRGPESLETLRFVYQHRQCIVTVLGNHDLHLLAIAAGYRKPSPSDTLDEILAAPDKDELLTWLRQQPLLHHDKHLGYTMVHAGIPPQWALKDARRYAKEVEKIIRSERIDTYLITMYGNKPDQWKKSLTDTERWRLITNYFTRMRFCNAQGQLELKTKASAEQGPKGYLPWFAHAKRKTKNNNIVFGHWAALRGKTSTKNTFAMDSGCVWGYEMTMMRLEDRELFSVKCKKT